MGRRRALRRRRDGDEQAAMARHTTTTTFVLSLSYTGAKAALYMPHVPNPGSAILVMPTGRVRGPGATPRRPTGVEPRPIFVQSIDGAAHGGQIPGRQAHGDRLRSLMFLVASLLP